MKGEKNEGKQMVPLFPGLHINDGDKGGPRAPPRNKMALFEEYNVNSESSKIGSGSRSMLPLPPSNGCSSLVSHASSSSNIAGTKRKAHPVLATMNECAHSSEWYYSHFPGGVLAPANYPNPASLMMKAKSISIQPPRGFSSYSSCGNESDFAVRSFLQSGKPHSYRNLQLHPNKEKVAAFAPVSSGKLHSTCLKLLNDAKSEDETMEHHGYLGDENSKKSRNYEVSLAGNKMSELNNGALQPNQLKKNFPCTQIRVESKFLQKSNTLTDAMSEKVISKGFAFAMEDSLLSSPRVGDCNQRTKINSIKKLSDDMLKVGIAVKEEEISETSMEGSIVGLDLTPDEVVRVIGQRLFLKARKTMVHQQKIFSLQIFELHRLITVQKLIARSPQILHENNYFRPNRSSIKFPPMNKLLYVSPFDSSSAASKTKLKPLNSDPSKDCGPEAVRGLLPLPTTNVEKVHLSQQLAPKPLPSPSSIAVDPKLANWCFHSPPGNQWLVPVRSPSEGLVYKPYPGPCFPTVGFVAPVYGNCGPISVSSLTGSSCGIPASNEPGNGGFYGPELGQSYFQTYPMPLINASGGSNQEMKQMMGIHVGELDKNSSTGSSNYFIPCQNSFKVSSQQSAGVSDCGGNLRTLKESDRQGREETSPPEGLERDALSLFPTTPSVKVLKDQRNEQRVQAIKVVPHNRNSAPASAARIFQSIQEERRKQ